MISVAVVRLVITGYEELLLCPRPFREDAKKPRHIRRNPGSVLATEIATDARTPNLACVRDLFVVKVVLCL